MEEKLRFVYEYERDEATMVELCASFGISRETGYVWLRPATVEQAQRALSEPQQLVDFYKAFRK
jgi:transposase-like protein